MFKIKYIPTGHIFIIPEKDAKLLKEKSPDEYIILEKNGKKFKDKATKKRSEETDSILSKVLDRS